MAAEGFIAGGILLVCLIIFLVIFIIGLSILAFVFWILMLIDCAKRDFKEESTKVIWIVVLALFHVLAAIIYYFAVKRPEDRKHPKK